MAQKMLSRKRAEHKSVTAVFLMILIILVLSVTAVAAEEGKENRLAPDLDADKMAQLTLNLTYIEGKEETGILAGAKVHLHRVADMMVDGGSVICQWLAPYNEINLLKVIQPEHMTAARSATAAKSIKAYITEQKLTDSKTKISDSSGKVTFSGLLPGLYLVYRDAGDIPSSKEGKSFEPFLVMVPSLEQKDGETVWDYNTEAFPKIGVVHSRRTSTGRTGTSISTGNYGGSSVKTGTPVKTGDDTQTVRYLMMLSGAGIMLVAAMMFRKKRKA